MKKIIAAILILSIIPGCTPVEHVDTKPKKYKNYSKSFVKVEVYLKNKKKKIGLWVGSGSYVKTKSHAVRSKKILTAAHVCHISSAAKIKLALRHRINLENYEKHIRIKTNKFNTVAKVTKLDKANDICVMKAKRSKVALGIAKRSPKYGENFDMISAPLGIHAKDMNLIFSGKYSGDKVIRNQERSLYTIPAAGGASGSAIINEDGNVVGIVSMGVPQFKHVVISPQHGAIYDTLY